MEYIKCDKCNGNGIVLEKEFLGNICPKCDGKKELDWVENIVGVKRKFSFEAFSSIIPNEVVEHLSKEICLDVDRHIMEKIIKNGKI